MQWAAILTFLSVSLLPLLVRIITGLGISIIVFSGVDLGLQAIRTQVFNDLTGIGGVLLQFLYILQLDKGISILFAAFSLNLFIRVKMGAMSRVAFTKPL